MNTANIKTYAPKARNDFMQAVAKRLNQFGIDADKQGQLLISDISIDGSVMQVAGNSFDASLAKSRQKLVEQTQKQGFNQFVEHTAYTWFNRFCAIRFMELHDYLDHGLRVLSHPDKDNSFEILDHAQDVAQDLGLNRDHIIELKLAGNQDEQLYRELLLGQCHKLHQAMPFLFEALDDETELLLPDNLTRTDSILRGLVNDIPEQDWQQVEIIGWLYQFYISEKKDQVIGKVVKSADIPAATQLFTPNWIVKYLVQNSVGRKWLQTYPDSTIKSAMEYYIEPAQQTEAVGAALAAITPDTIEPETIKVLDPACGSGHILVEAYNVLKAIYEERGYQTRKIPQLILENNLFGLDIDDRAAQLAGFALMMLARADDRRIFTRDITLNVLSIQESKTVDLELNWRELNLTDDWGEARTPTTPEPVDDVGVPNVTPTYDTHQIYDMLQDIWTRFEQGKTFGSLVDIPAHYEQPLTTLLNKLNEIETNGEFLQRPAASSLKPIVRQAWMLAKRYDAVVANPPYMGGKYQTAPVKKYLKDNFKGYEKDLFSAFIIRNLQLAKEHGQLGFMTPFVWMFISSYEKLRAKLIDEAIITTLIQLEYSGFDGATVPICTFTLSANHIKDYVGGYIKLSDFKGHKNQAPKTLEAIQNRDCDWIYEAKPDDFKKIPGSPIAYWVSDKFRDTFIKGEAFSNFAEIKQGMATSDNNHFLRQWFEVDIKNISFDCNSISETENRVEKWYPYKKGGDYRKWYGNDDYVVNWWKNGYELKEFQSTLNQGWNVRLKSRDYYFKPSISWSFISSSYFGVRQTQSGFIFDVAGSSAFPINVDLEYFTGLLCSKSAPIFLETMNPTLNFQVENVAAVPILQGHIDKELEEVKSLVVRLIELSKVDWDNFECSWNFTTCPLLNKSLGEMLSIESRFNAWVIQNSKRISEMKCLEEKNNKLFNEAYDLKDEITAEVDIEQITLTVNPKYRYGGNLSDKELENRIQSDTLSELISYSIGCMMGRYSLDRQGLVYAHAGNEGFAELEQQGAYNTFPADDDGIIPLTDQEWFADDVTLRFREFVQTVWGKDNLQANLDFVAESLCLYAIKPKSNETSLDTIRRYLSTQFYKDHLKTYKKRPIYWLFSSGKQKAFECLVYLHRYNESTLARMRTEYVTPLLGKYDAQADTLKQQIDQATSTAESNRLSKTRTALEKKQTELREFDNKLKHHADMQIKLDLDDGVKVNYGKFGDLLVDVKAVHGKAVN